VRAVGRVGHNGAGSPVTTPGRKVRCDTEPTSLLNIPNPKGGDYPPGSDACPKKPSPPATKEGPGFPGPPWNLFDACTARSFLGGGPRHGQRGKFGPLDPARNTKKGGFLWWITGIRLSIPLGCKKGFGKKFADGFRQGKRWGESLKNIAGPARFYKRWDQTGGARQLVHREQPSGIPHAKAVGAAIFSSPGEIREGLDCSGQKEAGFHRGF